MESQRRIAQLFTFTTRFLGLVTGCLLLLHCPGCRSIPGKRVVDLDAESTTAEVTFDEPSSLGRFRTASSARLIAPSVLPEPSATSSYSERQPEWPLSIEEAIVLAISCNRDLIVEQFSPHMERQQICIEESIFDPAISLGGQWSDNTSQVTNVTQGPGSGVTSATTTQFGPPRGASDQARISRKLQTGGEVSAGMTSNYLFSDPGGSFLLFNPSLRSTAQVEVTHPLFQGAGTDVTRIRIRMAEDAYAAGTFRLEIKVRQTVSHTAMAYWKLFGARARLASREKGVNEGEVIFLQETEKLELGESSKPEVAAARAQMEQFRVSRAQAQRDVADAERDLRTLIGAPLEDGRKIIPVTLPVLDLHELDWQTAMEAVAHSRPEIQLQNSSLHLAQLRHFSSHDGLRPDIRAYAGWGVSGTGSSLNSSLQTMTSAQYENWWTGVMYQKQLGGRSARSVHEQSRLSLARERAVLEMTEQDVYEELHAAHQRITNAWEVMRLSADRRDAATEVLEARKEMHALGEMSLQDYLSALSAWEQSIADQRQAIAEYNSAIVAWEYAKGSILAYQQIEFPTALPAEQVPPVPADETLLPDESDQTTE